jgi:uncharacterized protein
MINFLRVCWLALTVTAGAVDAATVNDLHTATVPVTDSSDAEFARGIAAAFEVVLLKLTGDSATLKQSSLRKLVARASQYNTVFGYEHAADGSLHLRADFDLPAVSGALRERGFRVWGKERPELTVWLVVIDSTGRYVRPVESNRAIFDALATTAARRSIPLRRPVADTVTNLIAGATNEDELLNGLIAALPPDGPATLVGVIRQMDETTWQGRWSLSLAESPNEWTTDGALPAPLAVEGIERAVDAMARHYSAALVGGGDSVVQLTVTGVATPDDYGRVLNYLATLDPVVALDVRRLVGSQVEFELKAHGGLAGLTQVIGFGQVLAPSPDNPTTFQLNVR